MSPFPTLPPEFSPDAWQAYTVAVREWQGEAVLLLVFAVVVVGALALFALGTLLVPAVVRR